MNIVLAVATQVQHTVRNRSETEGTDTRALVEYLTLDLIGCPEASRVEYKCSSASGEDRLFQGPLVTCHHTSF